MAKTTLIEVRSKKGTKDPTGEGLYQAIRHLHLAPVKGVTSSQLYRIVGELSANDRARIGRDLLCDPVIQEYSEGTEPAPGSVVIDVWYKPGVTDVVGESVLKGIRDLHIKNVEEVRTGMRYRLWGTTRKTAAEKVGFALLVNPLVHEPSIYAD